MAKALKLGDVCPDCFTALNFAPSEMSEADMRAAALVAPLLSGLAERENVIALHTGASRGFATSPCVSCGSQLLGERWPLIGLQERKDL